MTELWNDKVTIYNDIPANKVEDRHFDCFVINKCQVQGGFVSRANGNIQNIINAKTVITKDIEHYLPADKYAELPVDKRNGFYTLRNGDFVVFGDVDDIVTTSAEYSALQKKYGDVGIKVMSFSVSINGMATDNISMSNV